MSNANEPLTTEQPCEHDWLDMHEAGNWGFVCQKCGANSPRAQRTADPKAAKELLDRWEEYQAAEAECCPVCGSFSPSHIQEDDDGPCREVPSLSQYLR